MGGAHEMKVKFWHCTSVWDMCLMIAFIMEQRHRGHTQHWDALIGNGIKRAHCICDSALINHSSTRPSILSSDSLMKYNAVCMKTAWIYLGVKIVWRIWYYHRETERLLEHLSEPTNLGFTVNPQNENNVSTPCYKATVMYFCTFFSLFCPRNGSSHILYLFLTFISFHQDCTFESPLSPLSLVTTFTMS